MTRTGGCNCGAVRIAIEGEPVRAGLCHCQTCRRETGATFNAFAIWRPNQVSVTGETRHWTAGTDRRHFCPTCGSALFATSDAPEIEIRLGCLDAAPSGLAPSYELWIGRRETWQHPVPGAAQHAHNRPNPG